MSAGAELGPKGRVGWEMTLKLGGKTIGKAQNVNLEISAGEVNMTTRESQGWWEGQPGEKSWTVSGDSLWIPDSESITIISNALFARAILSVEMVDPFGYGWSGAMFITSIKQGENLNDAVTGSWTGKGTGALTRKTVES